MASIERYSLKLQDDKQELTSAEISEIINSNPEFYIDNNYTGKDFISIDQLSRRAIEIHMETTFRFREWYINKKFEKYENLLKRKKIIVNFAQQSSRTYVSFLCASMEQGAYTIGIPDALNSSSFGKGETLRDTAMTFEQQHFDGIVTRHPKNDSALRMALAVDIPIISGGSGTLEHPTQALLDLFTIITETQKPLDQLNIAFIGDLKYGRTVHSLTKILAKMGVKNMVGVSPEVIKLPEELRCNLQNQGVNFSEEKDIKKILPSADIFYVTRVQKEHTSPEEYAEVANSYRISEDTLKYMQPTARVMHPLPRVDEISPDADDHEKAAYKRQIRNGLYTRMSLLSLILATDQAAA